MPMLGPWFVGGLFYQGWVYAFHLLSLWEKCSGLKAIRKGLFCEHFEPVSSRYAMLHVRAQTSWIDSYFQWMSLVGKAKLEMILKEKQGKTSEESEESTAFFEFRTSQSGIQCRQLWSALQKSCIVQRQTEKLYHDLWLFHNSHDPCHW